MILKWYHKGKLCTDIFVRNNTISITNYTDVNSDRAFGVIENPTFDDLHFILEEQVMDKGRLDLKHYLKDIGVDTYDPIAMIRKTRGKILGNFNEIEVIDEEEDPPFLLAYEDGEWL